MANKSQPSNNLIEIKDLIFVWRLIRNNIALLIIVPSMAYAIGFIYTYRLPDVYGARTQLLLKSDQTYDYQEPIYKGLGAYGMYMDVRNQIRILESRDLIGQVVEKLNVDVSYYIVGRLKKSEVFGTYPFEADPIVYDEAQMYNIPINVEVLSAEKYLLSYEINEKVESFEGVFEEFLNTPRFGITLKKNYDFNEENLSHLNESEYEIVFHSGAYMIGFFKSKLSIENLEHTSILDVRITDHIAARGKMFLDTLSKVFIDHSKKTQLEINQNTLDNIEKQIDEVQKMLISIEAELLRYKNDNDIINLSEEERDFMDQYFRYSELNRELQTKLSSTRLLKNYILQTNDERFLPPSFYILDGDPYLNKKVEEYYTLQLQINDKSHNVTPDHPQVLKMNEDLVIMKKDILTYLKNLQVALNEQIAENDKMKRGFKKNVQLIPISQQGIENIKRELDINNKMYLFLLEKRTNTLIARAGIIPQVQVVESASSMGLIGPERGKLRKLFVLGGLIFALIVAFIRKIFFEKISNVSELEEITSLSVVAGIPHVGNVDDTIIVDKSPKSQVTECFRVMRSNLKFMGEKNAGKIVLISSFFPGEGKTFCSANFAVLQSMSERKVLLVDFDLHKPKVHKVFNMNNEIGISNYLIDNKTLDEIIIKDENPNLDIILSGPIPPNPSELLLKKKMAQFCEEISSQYDIIIFDTPPFGLLNDAVDLSGHANVFLAVINSKFARKRGVKNVEKVLAQQEVSTGIILNGIRQSRLSYYYSKYAYKYAYRYSYSMGYGYGYGQGYNYGESYEDENDD